MEIFAIRSMCVCVCGEEEMGGGYVEVLLHSKTLATKGEDKRDLPWALSW